jgi:hypothetical protein
MYARDDYVGGFPKALFNFSVIGWHEQLSLTSEVQEE